ncbi:GNAT family N-acetyltransferase [Intestinibacillus massiliensis]|nr:GNAT family N-acetyltransferase [Intestinibacillus massiliensis]
MRFECLRVAQDARYREACALYQDSFPYHEQREAPAQAAILHEPAYQYNLIYDNTQFVGLMLCWETARFIYVEHFCILPSMRNRQYGRKALELLQQKGKAVILEIDPPADGVSIRRKAFYERAGFTANGFAHVHPPYHAGHDGHKLVVMSWPSALSEALYTEFAAYLQHVIMEKV